MPSRRKSCFSTSRSCATSSAFADGIARVRRAASTGHVLELVRDGRGALGEAVEQLGIVVLADEQLADVSGRRIRCRIEEPEGEAERDPREREHPPELPATDDADDHADGSGLASTDSVWASR